MPKVSERAWAAGYFDARGCVGRQGGGVSVQIGTKDRDQLSRFIAVVGVGKVLGPYDQTRYSATKRKPTWFYCARRPREIRAIYRMLRRWLGTTKTAAFEEALTAIDEGRLPAVQRPRLSHARKRTATRRHENVARSLQADGRWDSGGREAGR